MASKYDFLFPRAMDRTCKRNAMSDSSKRFEWSGNLVKQLTTMLLSKTADQLANPKTVLTWLMGAMGAPVFLVGWLVPVRESLSMLPQFLMAGWIRSKVYRKPVWLLGAGVQGGSVLAMLLAGWKLTGALGGGILLLSLVVFSLGRALCSITGKDVLGKTIAKAQRGRVNGLATSGSGVLMLFFGAAGFFFLQDDKSSGSLLLPLSIAFLCWGLAWFLYASIEEKAGEMESPRSGRHQLKHAVKLLSRDRDFRNFVIARALMTGSALLAPYIVLYSQFVSGPQMGQLGGFVFAGAAASMMSGWIWGGMADISSRRVLMLASLLAGLSGLSLLLTIRMAHESLVSIWLFPACYMLLIFAHDGVRVGRKTFLINLGSGNKRTDYVSISNSIIGFFLILIGVLVSTLHGIPVSWLVFIFGSMCLMGTLWVWLTLPCLEKLQGTATSSEA
ncbi:MFS transporter [bacterium]|nr:MFS transporter [bacterium]